MSSMLLPPHPTVPRASALNMLKANSTYADMISTLVNNQTYGIRNMPPAAFVNNMTSNFAAVHYPHGAMYSPLANPQLYAVQLPPAAQHGAVMHAAFIVSQYSGHINAVPASGYGSNMFSNSPLPHPFSTQGCK